MYTIADHKLIQVDDTRFLFLSERGTIFEIDAGIAESLQLGKPDKNHGLFNELVDRGVYIPQQRLDHFAPKTGRFVQPFPLQTLVLHVTEDCNLNCSYCYHAKGNGKTRDRKVMSLATAQNAVDFLLANAGPLEEVTLVFFGGEPLMNYDLVAKTAEYATEQGRSLGKRVSFSLTTNGTLLSPGIIDFLIAHDFTITVSLDGPDALHNRFRPFRDGRNATATIFSGLPELLKRTDRKPVAARVTISHECGDIPGTLAQLQNMGFAEVGFAPVTSNEAGLKLDDQQMDVLLDQFSQLADRFVELAGEDRLLGFSNLIDLLVNLHEGEVKQFPCGAGLDLFAVDSQGQLFLCQRLTGEDRYQMGSIFDGMNLERLNQFRQTAFNTRQSECQGCWLRYFCAGGCYHESLVRQGNAAGANHHYCDWLKRWTTIGLETYARISLQQTDFLDKLSEMRGNI